MMKAALTNVKGTGVSVLIEDSLKPIQSGENPNLYVIHDEDILRIVNELRAGGAEAIAINDQRLIGTSEIRCSGPTITVNGKVFGAPFTVKAIGDPKTLSLMKQEVKNEYLYLCHCWFNCRYYIRVAFTISYTYKLCELHISCCSGCTRCCIWW